MQGWAARTNRGNMVKNNYVARNSITTLTTCEHEDALMTKNCIIVVLCAWWYILWDKCPLFFKVTGWSVYCDAGLPCYVHLAFCHWLVTQWGRNSCTSDWTPVATHISRLQQVQAMYKLHIQVSLGSGGEYSVQNHLDKMCVGGWSPAFCGLNDYSTAIYNLPDLTTVINYIHIYSLKNIH